MPMFLNFFSHILSSGSRDKSISETQGVKFIAVIEPCFLHSSPVFACLKAVITGAARRTENKVFYSSCCIMKIYAAMGELRWKKKNNKLWRNRNPYIIKEMWGHIADHS